MEDSKAQLKLQHCYEMNSVPTNSYVEALTPTVTVFRDGPMGGNEG